MPAARTTSQKKKKKSEDTNSVRFGPFHLIFFVFSPLSFFFFFIRHFLSEISLPIPLPHPISNLILLLGPRGDLLRSEQETKNDISSVLPSS